MAGEVAQLLVRAAYVLVLVVVGLIDLRTRLVYPSIVYPATLAAMVAGPLVFPGWQPWGGLAGAALGAVLFGAFLLLANRLYPGMEAFGFGDVMIAMMIGALVGLDRALATLLVGSVIGGLSAAVVGIALRSRRAYLPYGPGLCAAAILALLTGWP